MTTSALFLGPALAVVVHATEAQLGLGFFPLFGGEPVPFDSLGIVFRYALALVVHDPDVELRFGETLLRSLPEPLDGFGLVFGNTVAAVIHDTEVVLRTGETLLRSLPEPLDGFGLVFGNTVAVGIHDPEVELRGGVTLLGAAANFGELVRVLPEHPRRY